MRKNKHSMLMHEVMNKQLLYHYRHNVCFIFQCSIHTYEECQPSKNIDRTYQNQNIQSTGSNCFSHISVLVLMLLNLYWYYHCSPSLVHQHVIMPSLRCDWSLN
jgi:hypothetical protein